MKASRPLQLLQSLLGLRGPRVVQLSLCFAGVAQIDSPAPVLQSWLRPQRRFPPCRTPSLLLCDTPAGTWPERGCPETNGLRVCSARLPAGVPALESHTETCLAFAVNFSQSFLFFFCTWHFSFPHCAIEEGLLRNVGSAYANGNELRKKKLIQDEPYFMLSLARKAPVILQRLHFFFSPTASHSWCVRTWRGPATQLTQLLL